MVRSLRHSGIWIQDVTVEDYAVKKDKIPNKYAYFDLQLSQTTGADYEKFVQLKESLTEFEQKGKEYELQAKKVKNLKKELEEAQKKAGIWVDNPYSEERKNDAYWFQNTSDADTVLRGVCGKVWKKARDIERLYKAGLLVSKEKISTAHIEVELNRSNEYRIVKIQHGWTYDYGKDKRTGVILEACKLYEAYSKAKEEKERIEAKYKAERALSDYEWSVREIDKVLRLLHDDTLAKEYRRILLSMANVDDIEIKKIGNIIYYRYFSKKEPYKMVQL